MKKIISIIIALVVVTGAFAQLDRSKRPEAGPAPEIKLGKIESFTLENGLKVFVVENHKLPKVAFSLSLDIDPVMQGDMAGYVDLTGQLLEKGTTNRTKDQINSEIDFIGARLSTSAEGVYGSSLKKHQDKLLDVMSDIVMNANLNQEELDKLKKQTISGLASEKDDPDAIASNVRAALIYGKKHPYGEIVTEETVEKVTLEKCKEYYATYFKPNVAYLAVVGDINLAEAKPLIEKYFGKWEKGEVPANKYKTPYAPEKTRVAVAHKTGAVQSVINITYPVNLKPGSPDAIKARVMNSILGGGSSARLFRNLREAHGFTYGAYSSLRNDDLVGYFNANAKVRNEVTDSSVTEFMVELNKMVNEKVTQEELDGVKNYITGIFAYTLQDPQTIARFAINTEKYNLPADYYATYLKQLSEVTIDDIHAMAKKYIKPDNAIILVVGDKNEVSDKLTGFSAYKKVELYDNYGNDYVEPLKDAPEGVTAESVMADYVKAKYGDLPAKKLAKKLKKIKDVTTKMNASIQGQTISITTYQKAPNKHAQTVGMGSMVIQKTVFDGTKGKESGMQGNKDVTGEDLEKLKLESVMFAETKYAELGYKYELLGIEALESGDAYKLKIVDPFGEEESAWFDVKSGLKVKTLKVTENEQMGGSITAIGIYADYKEVNGIKYAHKISQVMGPQALEMEVTSIEMNTKLGDDVFSAE